MTRGRDGALLGLDDSTPPEVALGSAATAGTPTGILVTAAALVEALAVVAPEAAFVSVKDDESGPVLAPLSVEAIVPGGGGEEGANRKAFVCQKVEEPG